MVQEGIALPIRLSTDHFVVGIYKRIDHFYLRSAYYQSMKAIHHAHETCYVPAHAQDTQNIGINFLQEIWDAPHIRTYVLIILTQSRCLHSAKDARQLNGIGCQALERKKKGLVLIIWNWLLSQSPVRNRDWSRDADLFFPAIVPWRPRVVKETRLGPGWQKIISRNRAVKKYPGYP